MFPDLRGIPPYDFLLCIGQCSLQFGWIRTWSRSSVSQGPFTCKKQKPSWKWLEGNGDFIGKTLGKLTERRQSLRNQDVSRDLREGVKPGSSRCRLSLSLSLPFLSLTGFIFSYCSWIFSLWLETWTLVTPNSYPFSSVTQEAIDFLSSGFTKYFGDRLIGLAWVSFPDLCPLDEANCQKRWGRDAEQIKQ